MTLADIKTAPLAVWDSSRMDDGLFWQHWQETHVWAGEHISDVDSTYRVEFFLVDAPFAVVWRYKLNPDGRVYLDPETGDTAKAEPVVLDELPPAHLLGRPETRFEVSP